MKPSALALFVTLVLAAAPAAAQTAPPRSTVALLDAAAILARCDAELAAVRAMIATMERGGNRRTVLAEFNTLALQSGGFAGSVYLLANVSPDKATRDAAQVCVEKFAPLDSEIFQSQSLLQRVRAFKPADAADAAYRTRLLENFEDSGASLPPQRRARAKAIDEELSTLGLAFQKAVNEDNTTVTLALEDAAGMPESWLAAQTRDAQGRLVLRMSYPTVLPFMSGATREEARRQVHLAFARQGGTANLERLDRALALRHELAQLHGKADYASFALQRRMAGTPQAVNDFLRKVQAAVDQGQRQELEDLRAEKAAFAGQAKAEVNVQRWDVAFLQERIRRQRYAVDQEQLRAYFPTEASLQFAMRVAERLYGIEFVPATGVPVWHPDVRVVDVHERADSGPRGRFIGTAYLDLFPREGKYSHAAAFPVAPGSRLAGRRPTSVLVTNFNPKGLDHEELETLLHEFGHVLHGVLSEARYADLSGTSVKRDFVEAPSQMFEEWARRPETLAVLAEVCPLCPRLSPEQLRQLDAARSFGRGIRYFRQWSFAAYDMLLHTGRPRPAMATWEAMERNTPLGYVEGTLFPASFGHLMGGYAAGYYGYMWSEVMALDMLSAFRGRLMDPAVGRRYRDTILAPGGEVPPQQLVQRFLGRKPSPDAFFAELQGRR
jgi:thimet oligopeptidase